MKILNIINPLRNALKHLTLAAPLGAALWLGAGPTAQAIPPVTNGLVVWLAADSVNPADPNQVRTSGADNFVKQWNDGSGNAHHATQTTDANQPKYIASGVGGKPVLRFTEASSSKMVLGDLSASFPTAGSIFAVSTINSDGRYNLFGNRSGGDERWVANTWNESHPGSFRNNRAGGTFTLASWPQSGSHVFSLESSSNPGGIFRMLIDGAQIGSDSADYHNGSGANWTIGCRPDGDQTLNGDIPEFILYNRVLTTTEANMVGAYLTAKYGLTNAYPALPAPEVPTGVAAVPVSSGSIRLTWATALGATSYNVSATNTSTSVEQVVIGVTSPCTFSGLTNGTTYSFKVSSTNSTGTSAFSDPPVTAAPTQGTACDMLTFVFPGQPDAVISGTTISLTVPTGTDVTALAPTFTVSANATGSPASGTALNFTGTQSYTVTAEDGVTTKTYFVTVTPGAVPNIFTWTSAVTGNWSDSAKWTNNLATGSKPISPGQADYTLNFTQAGTYTTTQNLGNGFLLNQLNFGGSVTLDGANGLALTSNGATLPTVNQNSGSGVTINTPVSLAADTTLAGSGGGQVNLTGLVAGTGSLTKSNSGTLQLYGNVAANTYSGGTNVTSGTLLLGVYNGASPYCANPAGTGPVTLSAGTTLQFERVGASNALIVNGNSTMYTPNGWGVGWSGPITLNATLTTNTPSGLSCSGGISGTGGIIKTSGSNLTLAGTLSYTGPTAINAGTVTYSCTSNQTLPSDISGTGNLVKDGAGRLALAGLVSHTGTTTLTAGTLAYNNAAAKTFSNALSGAGNLEQAGPGTLTLAAANTYTGSTTVSGGTLNVTGSTSAVSNVTVASGATLTGTGTIGGNVTLASGALASFTLAAPYTAKLTCAKALNLNGNVVHVNLGDALPDGSYVLASYASVTGNLAVVPVIDSGTLLNPGTLMSVQATGGSVVLTVGYPPITITPDTLPNGTTIAPYSQTLGAVGGYGAPYDNYTVVSGSLPLGLTLTSAGVLAGAPTTLGTYTFAVQVQDQYGYQAETAKSYTIHIVLPNVFTWVSPVTGDWSDASMWSNNEALVAAPAANGQADYTLNFNQAGTYTATQNLNDGFLLNQLNFGGAVTLAGTNGIALSNNGATLPTVNHNSNWPVTISVPLSLAADTTIGGTGNATLSISGAISGSGKLIKTTANQRLELNGTNSYTGGTLISGGTLHCSLQNPSPLGASVNVTVQSGATLSLDRNQITGSLTLNGGTLATGNGWSDDSWTGPIDLAATSTINVGSTDGGLTVNGVVSGTGGLIKLGPSPRPVNLLGDNTFSGDITISAGVLAIGGSGRLGSGTYAATIANNGSFAYNSTTDQTLSGVISGSGTLTKSAASTLTLTASNTYTGATTISGGTLVIGGAGQLNAGAYAANIALSSSTATLTYNSSAAQTLSGVISGSGALSLTGSGTLTLGTNTYSGDTTVTGGILAVNGSSLSDTGKLIITGGKVEATGTETVDTLFFGTTQKAAGTWGASGSGATHIDNTHFAGTAGMVLVLVGPAALPDYETWASEFPGFTDTAAGSDPDGDGLTNLQEYAFGLDPTKGSSVNPITSALHGGQFTYTRRNPDLTTMAYTVWTSPDLQTWTEDTGATQAPDSPTAEVQTVTVMLTAAPSNGKLFVRVMAVGP